MAGISSISDIFRKDEDGEYIRSNTKLAQKILSYILVNQKGESSQIMSKTFYDRDLARWLLDHYIEFVERYQDRPYNRTNEPNKVENVLRRIKDLLSDLENLSLIEFEKAKQRRGTTDIIKVYKPTFAGHLIALLIETMESGKQPAISTEIYNLFGTYFKDHFSSYDVFYAKLFKKYKDNGLFDEFGVDTLISRLNSGREIRTINNLVQRLDLLYFDDAKKAKLYIELLIEVLKELKPKVKWLLLYEIKLILQQEMATRVRALHKEFDERCFELRERPDVIVLEGNCQKCDYYITMDCEILHYLKRSNLSPHTALNGVKCPRCKEDKCIIIPRL